MNPDSKKKDVFFRNGMLITGGLAGLSFILSLVSLAEFPSIFKYFVIGEILFAILFLVLRTVYRFRDNYRIKSKK